jgi:tripartite-type tricarboxylate transporter receptor subunit TctC
MAAHGPLSCHRPSRAAVARNAQADNCPNQPIPIVVPFNPGGSVDILGGAVGQKLQEK